VSFRTLEATDRQIDVLVYEIYGLTEEVAIIEVRQDEMGKKDTTLRGKVISAFKGFMRSYELEPLRGGQLKKNQNYLRLIGGPLFYKGKEAFELFYHRQAYDRLLHLVDRLYSGQVDGRVVHRHLKQTVTEWIEQGHSPDDQLQLEQTAASFLDKVERELSNYVLYVPIEGLEGSYPQGLKLGRCQLYRNSQHSELVKLLQAHRRRIRESDEYLSSIEQVPAFFQVSVSGHSGRADQEAKKEARLALNILRLFLGSYYFDVYQRPSVPRRIDLVGTLPTGEHSLVFRVQDNRPIEEQFPGSSVQIKHYEPFKLSSGVIKAMNDSGLARINRLVCKIATGNKGSIGPRLLRSINWFAKATTTDSIADSFLMYAISLESLLSEGNTPKETYARRMAALVTREDEDGSYPLSGHRISAAFHERLEGKSQSELFSVVETRVVELFGLRNDVAHGRVLDYEIDPLDLLDFETLVRCSILSFVGGGWDSLEQFKGWVRERKVRKGCLMFRGFRPLSWFSCFRVPRRQGTLSGRPGVSLSNARGHGPAD